MALAAAAASAAAASAAAASVQRRTAVLETNPLLNQRPYKDELTSDNYEPTRRDKTSSPLFKRQRRLSNERTRQTDNTNNDSDNDHSRHRTLPPIAALTRPPTVAAAAVATAATAAPNKPTPAPAPIAAGLHLPPWISITKTPKTDQRPQADPSDTPTNLTTTTKDDRQPPQTDLQDLTTLARAAALAKTKTPNGDLVKRGLLLLQQQQAGGGEDLSIRRLDGRTV